MSTVKALNDHVVSTFPVKARAPMPTPAAMIAGTGEPALFTSAKTPGMSPRRPMASSTRDRPRIRLSATPSIAVTAPIPTIQYAAGALKVFAATTSGATSVAAALASLSAPTVPMPAAPTAI